MTFGKTYRQICFVVTYNEIKLATGSFFKKEQMKVLQYYESLANIVSMALGGGKDKKPTPDRVHNVSSVDELEKALRGFSNGR